MPNNYPPEFDSIPDTVFTKDEVIGFIRKDRIGMEKRMDATYPRDRDWILAMGHALGLDSGHRVPIVPSVEEFKRLFAALTANQAAEAPPVAVEATKAVARERLSDGAIKAEVAAYQPQFRPDFKSFWQGVRFAERHHGIGLDNKEPK